MLKGNTFASSTRKEQSPFDVIVFKSPHSPWLRLLLSQTRLRTLKMAPCNTPLIIDISLSECSRHDNRKISFYNYRSDIGWPDCHFGFRWLFAYSNDWQLNMINTNAPHRLWEIGKISTPRKEGQPGQDTSDGWPSKSKGHELIYIYIYTFSGPLYWQWLRFPSAVRQNSGTNKVIQLNWRAVWHCYCGVIICLSI